MKLSQTSHTSHFKATKGNHFFLILQWGQPQGTTEAPGAQFSRFSFCLFEARDEAFESAVLWVDRSAPPQTDRADKTKIVCKTDANVTRLMSGHQVTEATAL